VRRAISVGLLILIVTGSVAILAPAPPVAAAGQIEVYKSGLSFPIALAFSSDGRIFYAEKDTGSIRIIYLANRTLLPTPFYTLPNTDNAGERGLLGLALDPGFPGTPYLYVYQTYNDLVNGTVYNRIVRILANGNTGVSYTVILRMPPLGATIHNGGVIAFGPDGKLYAVVGENGIQARSQDPLSPMGKVLRMETNGSAPPDNPFYGNPAWYNLTYTYGHRNMFGLAFHPITGRVFVTENGPNCNDEINLLPNLTALDRNYGWGPTASCGSLPPPADTNRDGPNPVLPIWWWGTTICPTNAAIYQGPSFPKWQGDLFMGECNPPYRFHRLHLVPPGYDSVGSDDILWTAPTSIIEVEQGRDGAIWLTTPTTIYRYWDSGKPPVASFTATPNPVIEGATVAFDASGSRDPDGTIDSYVWDFGDLTNGSGAIISHSYLTFGTFNVTLTVIDNESFAATTYRHIVVRAPPIASFTATSNPVVRTPVYFDASGSHDPDGTILAYRWDFGDSTNGTGAITSHPYSAAGSYNVTLNVTDNDSLSGTAYRDVVVRPAPPGPQPPAAEFTAGPSPTNPGSPVTFNASASVDPDGTIVSYAWEFGDSTTGSGVLITHAYANPGVFTVNLTVVDNQTLSSKATHQVTVNAPPRAAYQFAPATIYIGVSVTFDASTSTDSDGIIAWYDWDFGDGSTGSGVRSSHTYTVKGDFGVGLTVVDNLGSSNRTTQTISVRDRPPQITSSTPGLGPLTVEASATQTFTVIAWDPDGDVLTYTWRVDGALSGANTGSLDFASAAPGTHVVNVSVSDGALVASREWTVTVIASALPGLITLWVPIAIVVAVIVAIFFTRFLRRRKREPPPFT